MRREAYGPVERKSSEGCNPMGATGTKQGRGGARRSARRAAVRNRPRRLAGRGNPGMTCCLELVCVEGEQTSREVFDRLRPIGRPPSVTLQRRG